MMTTTTLLTILAPAIALLAMGLVKLILDRVQNK
jgi:hypothetical protein